MSQNNNLFQRYTHRRGGVLWQILVGGFSGARRRSIASRRAPENPPTKICHRTPLVYVCPHGINEHFSFN